MTKSLLQQGIGDTARRYLAVVQDERGYPPLGQTEPAPPEGPEPPTVHTVVKVEDYEQLYRAAATFLGDFTHPGWADYVATNLLDALSLVPDTGDWHGALRNWCEATMTGNLKPNRRPAL